MQKLLNKSPLNYSLAKALAAFDPRKMADFKFSMDVDYGMSQYKDKEPSLKGAWSRHVTNFKFLPPPSKNIWNG